MNPSLVRFLTTFRNCFCVFLSFPVGEMGAKSHVLYLPNALKTNDVSERGRHKSDFPHHVRPGDFACSYAPSRSSRQAQQMSAHSAPHRVCGGEERTADTPNGREGVKGGSTPGHGREGGRKLTGSAGEVGRLSILRLKRAKCAEAKRSHIIRTLAHMEERVKAHDDI